MIWKCEDCPFQCLVNFDNKQGPVYCMKNDNIKSKWINVEWIVDIRKELAVIRAYCKREDLKERHLWEAAEEIYRKLGLKW